MSHHQNQEKDQALSVSQEYPLAGIQILLVEDEFDIAHLLLFILADAGADVAWAMQSTEALAFLSDFRPHVLLSNIRLPDHNGDWLIQQVRRREAGQTRHLPAIAITSYTREFTPEKMLDAGFERFLSKVYDVEELVSTILELVN